VLSVDDLFVNNGNCEFEYFEVYNVGTTESFDTGVSGLNYMSGSILKASNSYAQGWEIRFDLKATVSSKDGQDSSSATKTLHIVG